MKRLLTFLFLFFLVLNCYAQDAEIKTAAIFDAMEKEMARTLSLSKTEPKIHFAAFRVADITQVSVIAARGGLVQTKSTKEVITDVSLRVGNDKEDNSFFDTISYNQNTIHSLILGTKCVFKGFDANRQDYVFEYTDTDNLNGMSGGPIIYEDSVIAVQHSIEKGKIYATPITTEFIRKAEMA